MQHHIRIALGGLLVGLFLTQAARAHEPVEPSYDRISLSASAQTEVPNDRLRAELYVQHEGEDAAALAAKVNRAVEWAVAQARQVPEVEVRTLDYRTHPLYRKQTLTGWRVRQAIRLKSADTALLSDLVGRLQERLAVESVGYELSPQGRREAENRLIDQAIEAFRVRAQRVSRQFGREDYRLVKVDIHSGSQSPKPMFRAASMAMQADMAPAPRFELGSQTVQIRVNGTIELRVK